MIGVTPAEIVDLIWSMDALLAAGLWLVVGFVLSYSRNIGLAVAVPLLVVGGPAIVALAPDGSGVQLFPLGGDAFAYLHVLLFPLVGSILGGYIAVAINPSERTRKQVNTTLRQARDEAERVTSEMLSITSALADAEDADREVLKLQLDTRKARLRDLRRQVA